MARWIVLWTSFFNLASPSYRRCLDTTTGFLIDLLSVYGGQHFGLMMYWLELLLTPIGVSYDKRSSILFGWSPCRRVLPRDSVRLAEAVGLAQPLLLIPNLLLVVLEERGRLITCASHRVQLLTWRCISLSLLLLFDLYNLPLNDDRFIVLILINGVFDWGLCERLLRSLFWLSVASNLIDLCIERLWLNWFFGFVVHWRLTLRRLIVHGTISYHELILL